jgi:hypothetical protein
MENPDKIYCWFEWEKAMNESGKSLAELYDFKTGFLIDRKFTETPHQEMLRILINNPV